MTEMKTYHTTLRNAALTLAALPARALATARALAPALALALSLAACTDTTDPATTATDDDTRLEGDALALVSPIITRAGDGGDGTTEGTEPTNITVGTLVTHLMKDGGNTYFMKGGNKETPAAATYIYKAADGGGTGGAWSVKEGSEPLRVSVAGPYYMRAVAAATRTDDGTQLIAVTGTPAKTSDTGTGGGAFTTGGSVTTPTQAATGTARISEATDGKGSFKLSLCPLSARLVVVLKSVDGTPVTTAHRPQATIAAEGQALKYMALPADTEKGFQLSADTWPEIAGSTSGSTGSSTGGPAPAKDNAAATQELIEALTVKEDRQEQTFALVDKDGKLLTASATTDDATTDDATTNDATDDTDAAPEARLALSNLAPAEYTSGSGALFTLLCYGDASGNNRQSYTLSVPSTPEGSKLRLLAGCTTTLTLTLGPDGELHVDAITVADFNDADKDIDINSGPKRQD